MYTERRSNDGNGQAAGKETVWELCEFVKVMPEQMKEFMAAQLSSNVPRPTRTR